MIKFLLVVSVALLPAYALAQIGGIKETHVERLRSTHGPGGWVDQIENLSDNTIVACTPRFIAPHAKVTQSRILN
jgi:hypothetical protein